MLRAVVHEGDALEGGTNQTGGQDDPGSPAHRRRTRTRPINGYPEALNGLFQAAKHKARGDTYFEALYTVLFLITGKGKPRLRKLKPMPESLEIRKSLCTGEPA